MSINLCILETMSEFVPISNPEVYKRSAWWSLSFFVQLGLGNDQNTNGFISGSVKFSLGSELEPMVTVNTDKNGHDRIQICMSYQDQQTLEQALGVGTEAVRTALETAGLPFNAITSVMALEYDGYDERSSVACYDTTQKAMEIETAIEQVGNLDSIQFLE